ncbi:MAG: peptidoglycan-binding protein [Moorea sp. SIO1G6]|uniref:HEAT repeat domain-containing protein n=1 Tax=Moorena sp. SIO1G6 TaxID=2607840 RepID=UPI0013C1B42D|nr:HEAT repeat domain-containing protein [Moorena sp. SIO1G6]NET65920.1 peptidoglycan-binding protein [Moorena sp. SIO1G6]
MTRHWSIILVATCLNCLGWVLGSSQAAKLEKANAFSTNNLPDPLLIAQSPTSATETDQPILLKGSRGKEVALVQAKLKHLDFYDGLEDGVYGEDTEKAVALFQESVGLRKLGVVDSVTRKELEQAYAAKTTTTSTSSAPKSGESVSAESTTTEPSTLEKSPSSWLIIPAIIMAGGGFLLFKWLTKPKRPVDSKLAPSTENQAKQDPRVNNLKVQVSTDSQNHHPQRDYNHSVSYDVANPSNPQPQSLADSLHVKKTTRLTKFSIVEELIRELEDPDPKKRQQAIWELAQKGDSRAVKPLVDLMLDSDSKQRGLILEALSQISTKTLKPINKALAISLQDDNPQVRKNAIRDATRIYELLNQVLQMLRHATDDPDSEVRETAKWAIEQFNKMRPAPNLDSLPPAQNYLNSSENNSNHYQDNSD